MEAYLSIKHGITSKNLVDGHRDLHRRFSRTKIAGIDVGSFTTTSGWNSGILRISRRIMMNKYMGFYELKALNIPSVQWKLFADDTVLDDRLLWTVRVATAAGDDMNLPRAVGVVSEEARMKGREFLLEYGKKGIVIYYPYFIAEKSGVLDINSRRLVIEAVDRDLWNLVTHGRKDVTIIVPADETGETDGGRGYGASDDASPGASFRDVQVTGNRISWLLQR